MITNKKHPLIFLPFFKKMKKKQFYDLLTKSETIEATDIMLGSGGFGSVYSKNGVAVKEGKAIEISCERMYRYFYREIECMHEFNHPMLNTTTRISFNNNSSQFFMKIYKSLSKSIKFSMKQMAFLLEPIAAMHSIGCAHKDIKPLNFLFDEDSKNFILSDFGTLIVAGNQTVYGAHTVDYSPVDGFSIKVSDFAFDQYAALKMLKNSGLLYKLLSGDENEQQNRKFLDNALLKNETIYDKIERPEIIMMLNTIENKQAGNEEFKNQKRKYHLTAYDNFSISRGIMNGAFVDTYPDLLFNNFVTKYDVTSLEGLASFFETGMDPSTGMLNVYPKTHTSLDQDIRIAFKLYNKASILCSQSASLTIYFALQDIIANKNEILTSEEYLRLGQICEGLSELEKPYDATPSIDELKDGVFDDEHKKILQNAALYFYEVSNTVKGKYYTLMHHFRKYLKFGESNMKIDDIIKQLSEMKAIKANVQIQWYNFFEKKDVSCSNIGFSREAKALKKLMNDIKFEESKGAIKQSVLMEITQNEIKKIAENELLEELEENIQQEMIKSIYKEELDSFEKRRKQEVNELAENERDKYISEIAKQEVIVEQSRNMKLSCLLSASEYQELNDEIKKEIKKEAKRELIQEAKEKMTIDTEEETTKLREKFQTQKLKEKALEKYIEIKKEEAINKLSWDKKEEMMKKIKKGFKPNEELIKAELIKQYKQESKERVMLEMSKCIKLEPEDENRIKKQAKEKVISGAKDALKGKACSLTIAYIEANLEL